jgi:predicted Zn-dependent protease
VKESDVNHESHKKCLRQVDGSKSWDAPHDALTLTQLAGALLRNRRCSEALDYLHQAIHCDPDEPSAWLTLGRAYMKAGRLDDAHAALQIARRLGSLDPMIEKLDLHMKSMIEKAAAGGIPSSLLVS